jgi:hypothetical protein
MDMPMIRPILTALPGGVIRFLALVAFGLTGNTVGLHADPLFERVLIPLHIANVAGASGTSWSTELVARNEGEAPTLILSQVCLHDCTCGFEQCLFIAPTPPGGLARWIGGPEDFAASFPGLFAHIEKATAANVAFSLRLYEETLAATEFGTEVPVVRERDFLRTTSFLVNVPLTASARVHLRLYGLESPSGEAVVRVRVYPESALTPVYDRLLTIPAAPFEGRIPEPGDHNAIIPGYLILSLTSELSGVTGPVRVRVDPLTPELRYWLMGSVTSNTTHNVTLFTPQ